MIPDRNMTDKIVPLVIGGLSLLARAAPLAKMMARTGRTSRRHATKGHQGAQHRP